jgi:formate-dependent nitrite reductase cytochrome c552 subunit
MPADSVFKNVKILNAVSAKTLVSIMAGGYARALGVKCAYCHVEEDFSSDEKRPKRAAREMAAMHRMINQELRKMQYISTPPTENRAINCSTCHRGMINPMRPSR